MAHHADATLLPPPLGLDSDDEWGTPPIESRRSLDLVGPLNVLSAMVEQRRVALGTDDDALDTSDADETQPIAPVEDARIVESEPPRRPRVPAHSDAFLKAR